jgi:NAD(P)-dependent dehydrogenase (short-subunit alcohol dehydrogenase family)
MSGHQIVLITGAGGGIGAAAARAFAADGHAVAADDINGERLAAIEKRSPPGSS